MTLVEACGKAWEERTCGTFTRSGKPKCGTLGKLVGRRVSARSRDRAWKQWLNRPDTIRDKGKPNPPASRKPPMACLRARVLEARVEVSRDQLRSVIASSGLGRLYPEWLTPATYYALPEALWRELLAWSDVDAAEYVLGERDCKTFSMALAGQMKLRFRVTCIWVFDCSAGHAYNAILVVGEDGGIKLVAVEPQTDQLPQLGTPSHRGAGGKLVIL